MTTRRFYVSPVWWSRIAFSLLGLTAGGLLLTYILTANGHLDAENHALGRDFVNAWTSGRLQREGRVLSIFDPPAFLAAERRLFDPRLPFHFWSYPPPTLFMTAWLGWTPYIPGLVAWTLAGFVALVPAVFAFLDQPLDRALVLVSPAVAVNIGLGQNGAFTAALLLGGLTLMRNRPALAGVLFGLLLFKPQIGLLLPIAVLAERRWTTLWAAAATGVGLCLLSVLVYGVEAWTAFFQYAVPMQRTMLEHGRGPFLTMMPSPYIAARLLHWPAAQALRAQAPFTLLAAALVWIAYRRPGGWRLKAAVLCTATFIASPQAFNYDLIPVAAAGVVMVRAEDETRRTWMAMVGLFLAIDLLSLPLGMMPLNTWKIPLSPVVLTLAAIRLTVLARRRDARDQPSTRAASASTAGQVASNT